jgi:hypothetical protein
MTLDDLPLVFSPFRRKVEKLWSEDLDLHYASPRTPVCTV